MRDDFIVLIRSAESSFKWKAIELNGVLKLCSKTECEQMILENGTSNVRILRQISFLKIQTKFEEGRIGT